MQVIIIEKARVTLVSLAMYTILSERYIILGNGLKCGPKMRPTLIALSTMANLEPSIVIFVWINNE